MYEILCICLVIYLFVYSSYSNCITVHGAGVCLHVSTGAACNNRYTETHYNWSIQIISGQYRIVKTCIYIHTVINVHENGRGGKCVHKLTHAYA